MNLIKKVAVSLSSVAMVAAMAFVPAAASAATPGEVYKTTDGTVWFITSDMQKRPFTSAGAFLSYGFLSWSQVKSADASVTALPTGAFIAPQDGTVFCATETKGTDVKGECSLVTGGQKAAFTSADVFTGLGFSFARAQYGDSSFLSKTTNVASASEAHRTGVLVNNAGTVQLVWNGALCGVPSIDVFNSWGYSFANAVTANAADKAMTQSSVMVGRTAGQLVPTCSNNPAPTGPVTAALAFDNPAAGTVVTNQAAADLAKITFTGSGTVTGLTFQRIGVSADTSLSNVYLFDGATRLTDASSVSSGSMINFSNGAGLFTVSGSRTITVKSDLNAVSGETVGVKLVSGTLAGSSSLAGVPLNGNLMTVAGATLAGVSFGAVTPSSATIDPAKDVVVWQSTATVSTRDVWLDRLALREIGSINYSDINNFRLMVDGTTVATTSNLDSNGYVTFSPASPVKLTSGARVIKVVADIVGGSTRTATFSIRQKADLGLRDSQYNVGIATATATPIAAGTLTISTGSVTVQKASDSPSTDVTLGGNDVLLGKYTLTAYGEAVKIETLSVQAVMGVNGTAATTIRNGRILIGGTQYGSTTNMSTAAGTSYTVNYTVQPGTPVTLEVRGDIKNGTGADLNANDTILARIKAGTNNGQAQVSGSTINVPTTDVDANTRTVKSGSISLAKTSTYTNQTTTVPQTAYKIASYQLTGSSIEDVNVNTISMDFAAVAGTTFTSADMTNVYAMYNGERLTTKSTISASGNTWSISKTLPANGTATVDIYGDVGTVITAADSARATVTVSGTTVNSAQSVTSGAVTGQTILIGSSSVAATKDASSPVASNLDDTGTVTAAAFKFAATNDSYTISQIDVKFAAAPTTVSTVSLEDSNGNAIGSPKPAAGTVSFGGLSVMVPANDTAGKIVRVKLTLSTVGPSAGTSGEDVTVTLDGFNAVSANGTSGNSTTDVAANGMYVFKSLPTITNVNLPTTSLTGGTQTLAKFTISSNGTGTVAWKKIAFTVTKTAAPGLASFAVYDSDTNTQVAGAFTPTGTFTAAGGSGGTQVFVATNEEQITSKTYELRATVSGTLGTGDNVVTNIASGVSSHTAPAAYATVAGTAATFVWSDVSASSHSSSTTDWNDDYLVKNIPTNGQSLLR